MLYTGKITRKYQNIGSWLTNNWQNNGPIAMRLEEISVENSIVKLVNSSYSLLEARKTVIFTHFFDRY